MGWGGEGRGGGGRANPTQANGSLTPLCRAPGCLSESTYSLKHPGIGASESSFYVRQSSGSDGSLLFK